MKGIESKRSKPAKRKAVARAAKASSKKAPRKPVYRQMTREIAEARAVGRSDGKIVDAIGFLRTLKK